MIFTVVFMLKSQVVLLPLLLTPLALLLPPLFP